MTWVIVYRPGDVLYQALGPPDKHPSLKTRLVRRGLKALFATAQVWWYLKAVYG